MAMPITFITRPG